MAAKKNHIHKLRRHTYKTTGNSVFFCTLSDCTFKIETQFALGKTTLCNRCGQPFEMTSYAVALAKPHCTACHKPMKGNKNVSSIVDALLPESLSSESDRRQGPPTRREFDPTVIRENAEESIESLKDRLSIKPINPDAVNITYRSIEVDDEDLEL
jgi:hypothetical protein